MSTTVISGLYAYVRSILGDVGIMDDSGSVISNTYYWQDAVLKMAINLILLDTDTYSVTNSDYISPQLSNKNDTKFIVYSTALMLLLPERDKGVSTPHYKLDKESIEMQIGFIWQTVQATRNNGLLAYAKDGSLTHLANLATRMTTQEAGILDPDAPVVIPNDFIEVLDEDGNIVMVSTDI